MKRAIISLLLLVITGVITFAQDANYQRREESLISIYIRTNDYSARLNAVKKLSQMKSEKGLTHFIKDLCFPASRDGSGSGQDARQQSFRVTLAKALLSYTDLDKTKLITHFESMLRLVESEKVNEVVIATLETLTAWVKKIGGNFNTRFATAIRRRLSRTDIKDTFMITRIIDALEILKTDAEAQDILRNMLSKGLNERVKARINKILSSVE